MFFVKLFAMLALGLVSTMGFAQDGAEAAAITALGEVETAAGLIAAAMVAAAAAPLVGRWITALLVK